ncbi:hypothetical protein [Streptomyces mangrovisoli]|uniref:Uncharacterized protein n=1 Tax=Streptomyces mangrovisoli TaxID=1428628 RepID=A0A1J4P3X0_9ACTN|nr:hypothetical protein [Streptomyces mangrovisoli]OIJ68165.1 hypothetical protein WN71_008950 [Streptomyces mangrovisoli]
MLIGLLSTIAAVLYGGTVCVLALTATFARRRTLRREARSTLAVLVPNGLPGAAPWTGRVPTDGVPGPVADRLPLGDV